MNHVIHPPFHILCICQLCLQRLRRQNEFDWSDYLCVISIIWLDYTTLIPWTTNSLTTKNSRSMEGLLFGVRLSSMEKIHMFDYISWKKLICFNDVHSLQFLIVSWYLSIIIWHYLVSMKKKKQIWITWKRIINFEQWKENTSEEIMNNVMMWYCDKDEQ